MAQSIIFDPDRDMLLQDATWFKKYGLNFHHSSIRSGYSPTNRPFLRRYQGRFGYGVMSVEHRDAKTVTVSYYIKGE